MKENQLLLDSVEALRNNYLSNFAKFVNKSHELIRDSLLVSCPEIDWLVTWSNKEQGKIKGIGKVKKTQILKLLNYYLLIVLILLLVLVHQKFLQVIPFVLLLMDLALSFLR